MPAFITHYLYGVDLYHSITNPGIKKMIHHHLGAYRLGLQGPDLFFYSPLCTIQPTERNIGSLMHETKVSEFFQTYLSLMKKLTSADFEIATTYLCGLIAHYTLDSNIHPYIYARSGYDPDSGLPSKYYFGMHQELEACIDFILLKEHKNLAPSQFHASKTIHYTKKEGLVLSQILSEALKSTYGKSFLPGISPLGVRTSMLSTKLSNSLLHSNYGIRKKILYNLEHTILHYHVVATAINWDKLVDLYDAMNASHHLWTNPWDKSISSTASVKELYRKAKVNYLKLLPFLATYVNCPKDKTTETIRPLIKELGNYSYHSGLDCTS